MDAFVHDVKIRENRLKRQQKEIVGEKLLLYIILLRRKAARGAPQLPG